MRPLFKNLLLLCATLALFALSAFLVLNSFELKEEIEHSGFKGEARTNQLFAARMLLKRMGLAVERIPNLTTLPDPQSVVVLDTTRSTISERKIDELIQWVEDGGHLIARAHKRYNVDSCPDELLNCYNDSDPLQRTLGIMTAELVCPEEQDISIETSFPHSTGITLSPRCVLELLITDKRGIINYEHDGSTWMVQKNQGNGLITLTSVLDIIDNHGLANANHALWFWYLIHSHHPQPAAVWLIDQDSFPSLLQLIFQHAWTVLVSLALLLSLALWSASPRFGPVIQSPPPTRRQLLDHIDSAGRLLWSFHSKNGRLTLQKSVRKEIGLLAGRIIPGWEFMDRSQQLISIDEILKLHGKHVSELSRLLSDTLLDERGFTLLVGIANTLRNHK